MLSNIKCAKQNYYVHMDMSIRNMNLLGSAQNCLVVVKFGLVQNIAH